MNRPKIRRHLTRALLAVFATLLATGSLAQQTIGDSVRIADEAVAKASQYWCEASSGLRIEAERIRELVHQRAAAHSESLTAFRRAIEESDAISAVISWLEATRGAMDAAIDSLHDDIRHFNGAVCADPGDSDTQRRDKGRQILEQAKNLRDALAELRVVGQVLGNFTPSQVYASEIRNLPDILDVISSNFGSMQSELDAILDRLNAVLARFPSDAFNGAQLDELCNLVDEILHEFEAMQTSLANGEQTSRYLRVKIDEAANNLSDVAEGSLIVAEQLSAMMPAMVSRIADLCRRYPGPVQQLSPEAMKRLKDWTQFHSIWGRSLKKKAPGGD